MVLTIGRDALTLLLMISMPVLGVVMAVGLLVSIFQAVTQIHEATLAFVPKLIAAMVVFAIAGPWMLSTLVDFIRRTIESIPSMIGYRVLQTPASKPVEDRVITFTEAQLMAWLSPILWPFLRVLAVFSVAPVFSMRTVPMRVKIGLAFLVALCAQGVLGDQPVISVNSREAFGAVAQQVAVGLAIGFSVRLVFAAVELAGEII
eukprot:gene44369-55178_t